MESPREGQLARACCPVPSGTVQWGSYCPQDSRALRAGICGDSARALWALVPWSHPLVTVSLPAAAPKNPKPECWREPTQKGLGATEAGCRPHTPVPSLLAWSPGPQGSPAIQCCSHGRG